MSVPIVRSILLVTALCASPTIAVRAQATVPRVDSTRVRAGRDTLEAVVVRATRAGGAAPTSRTTLDRATIERTYAGQDAPLALLGTTGVTASSDAGAFSGYSAIRLRGIDRGSALLGRLSFARLEQAIEHRARAEFLGHRLGRRAPRDIGVVGAGIALVAIAGRAAFLQAHL